MDPHDYAEIKRRPLAAKRLAMTHVSMRLPTHVVQFYKNKSDNYTGLMREVLVSHTKRNNNAK